MKNIAIIPARSGSKRISRKNIRPFMGKPIMAYSIEAALRSGLFDEVMVSTDDEQFARIAVEYGASVPFLRSERTSGDYAGIADVIDEVIANYAAEGRTFDNWCCILSTAPFVTSSLLEDTYKKFMEGGFDTLRPVVRFSYPIQRAFRMDTGGRVSFMNPENAAARSQDLEPAFHDAGLFYWGTVGKGFSGKNWGALEIDEKVCQDIDTEEDWALAEMKYSLLCGKSSRRKMVIYAEGGLELGLGNIYRCISLANAAKEASDGKLDISFVTTSPENAALIVRNNGFDIKRTDSGNLAATILSEKPDCLLVDVLGITEDFIRQFKDKGLKVVIVGNNTSANHCADIVVNAIIGTGLRNDTFTDSYGTLNLWGPRYLVLRDEFERIRGSYIHRGTIRKIVLLFGGSDQSDYTSRVLKALAGKGYGISVIVGGAYDHFEELKILAEKCEGVSLYRNISNVSQIYKDADFLFTSPGTALFEGLCVGIPAISFYQNRSQMDVFGDFFTCTRFEDVDDIEEMMNKVYASYTVFKKERDFYDIGGGRRQIIDSITSLMGE